MRIREWLSKFGASALIGILLVAVAARAGTAIVESGGYNFMPGIKLTGSDSVLKVSGNGTQDLGEPANIIRHIYLSTSLRDSSSNGRVTIGGSTFNLYRGAIADGAGAVANKMGNATPLTAGTDRYIVEFNNDANATAKLYITTNGSVIPAGNAVSQLGGPTNRWTSSYFTAFLDAGGSARINGIGTTTIGTSYLGSHTDSAASYAHRFGNANALTSGTDRYIAEFYSDNLSTARVRITSNGSLIPAADNVAQLGSSSGRFASVDVVDIKQGGTNRIRLLSSGSPQTYTAFATDNAAQIAHSFRNGNSLTSGTDRYIAVFYNDDGSTAKARINSDGSFGTTATTMRNAVTLSAGSGTATVSSGAFCVCSSTTANPAHCSVSGTTLTVTGTGTDVVNYICIGAS